MITKNKKYLGIFFILSIVIILVLATNTFINKIENEKVKAKEPIVINLLTSVHPSLNWKFTAINKKIIVKPGDITTIEYLVENLDENESTGIATFAYYPNQISSYIRKLNCFCYDAQTLKTRQKDKYLVILLIDPEVTKDTKTKNIKEVTIQFTFFDYKEYKKNKS